MTQPAASRRDRFGKRFYPVPHPETREIHDLPAWTGLKNQMHSGGLETWKLKSVAKQIALRDDLQCLAADDSGTYTAVQQALDMSRSSANYGTAVHRYSEYVDNGTLDWDKVPTAAKKWVEAYARAVERFGWKTVESEVTVANLTVGYAGTADRFVTLPDEVVDAVEAIVYPNDRPVRNGNIFAFDIKTGKDVWPETALQLAAYSGAEFIWTPPTDSELPQYFEQLKRLSRDIASGENYADWVPRSRKWSEAAKKKAYATLDDLYWEEFATHPGHWPMPEGLRRDIGLVALLHEDECLLVPLKLDGALETVSALAGLWRWNQRGRDVICDPLPTAEPESEVQLVEVDPETIRAMIAEDDSEPRNSLGQSLREELITRIQVLPEQPRNDLAALWPQGVPTLKASQDHTAQQLSQIDLVLAGIEARYELPFV